MWKLQLGRIWNAEEEVQAGNELASEQDIPILAAKFAVPSGVGEPVDNDLANSTTYLIAHPLEEKIVRRNCH